MGVTPSETVCASKTSCTETVGRTNKCFVLTLQYRCRYGLVCHPQNRELQAIKEAIPPFAVPPIGKAHRWENRPAEDAADKDEKDVGPVARLPRPEDY
jgi:hypothetical protein